MYQVFRLAVVAMLAALPVRADDLDDAAAICAAHMRPPTLHPTLGQSIHADGWEHCDKIAESWQQRKDAADVLNDSKNPDMAKTHAVAKEIQ